MRERGIEELRDTGIEELRERGIEGEREGCREGGRGREGQGERGLVFRDFRIQNEFLQRVITTPNQQTRFRHQSNYSTQGCSRETVSTMIPSVRNCGIPSGKKNLDIMNYKEITNYEGE